MRSSVGAHSKGYGRAPIAAADDTDFVLHGFCAVFVFVEVASEFRACFAKYL